MVTYGVIIGGPVHQDDIDTIKPTGAHNFQHLSEYRSLEKIILVMEQLCISLLHFFEPGYVSG